MENLMTTEHSYLKINFVCVDRPVFCDGAHNNINNIMGNAFKDITVAIIILGGLLIVFKSTWEYESFAVCIYVKLIGFYNTICNTNEIWD